MKKLNHIKFALVLAVLVAGFTSCKKFLDVQPKDSVSDEETIFDRASAETAVRGLYRALSADGYYGVNFVSIGYLSGDNVQWTGSQSIVQQFIDHNVKADNATVSNIWLAIYTTINRANYIIAKLPEVNDATLTSTVKNQLLGEAYFVRALAYFDLARTWGGVQIVTTPTLAASDKKGIARSTVEQTYAQVLTDLDAAESLLTVLSAPNPVRANKETVYALKARFYLYQKDWANAEKYATLVLGNTTNYSLLKPYSAWFANNAVGTRESVLELAYSATYTNGHRGQWQPPANSGTRQWAPNAALTALLSNTSTAGGRSALIAKTSAGLVYGNLYYRSPATDPAYVIRIAELYLIRAEARANQNSIAGSLADLNAVRDRAGLASVSSGSKDDLLLAIENERRLEFALEGHRWFDLVRTGRAATVLGVTDSKKYLLPIPVDQLNVDPALTQNPGY
ncbi:RagB/SusD family nutrient uptake outer membrane protein [Mucilaginibacter pallidiroseus]|uniref:RagB/SusD family nutrient uptake outer membrane protein n=1 Tax=Mucilaginibacter pallidiroseus TaxID=2599295 RepID=A0A563TZD6_9SPHI|nr:RagB/SusD family nutrient uptake outer membrane protein [Mucilaginibacter pallidiroseus]TWR24726.1 RagB/SusD family nutrient uptake outer membrane protein [Mucilaginibacter pallidiroseus]